MYPRTGLRMGAADPLLLFLALLPLGAQVRYSIHGFAGGGSLGDGGPAAQALLWHVEGLAADGAGNVYLADTDNHRIRKVDRAGRITTLAGDGIAGYRDGAAARFTLPYGVSADLLGNVYVADLGNRRVRKIQPDGVVSTVAGLELRAPRNVAVARDGSLYVADFEAHRVYRVSAGGAVSVAAGTGTRGYTGDGGLAADAALAYPAGLAVDQEGALFVGDTGNKVVRRVAGGMITTVLAASGATGVAVDTANALWVADAGSGRLLRRNPDGRTTAWASAARDVAVLADGTVLLAEDNLVKKFEFGVPNTIFAGNPAAIGDNGEARSAVLRSPAALARDALGNVYIAERAAHRIRAVTTSGTIVTVAGMGVAGFAGDGGAATRAQFDSPAGLAVDAAGNIYVADQRNHRIRRITRAGAMATVAGTGEAGFAGDGGEARSARLNLPAGIAITPDGRLWILDAGNAAVRIVEGTRIRTVATELRGARGITALADGAVLVLAERRVIRIDAVGSLAVRELPAAIEDPVAVAALDAGWLISSAAHRIYRVTDDNRAKLVAGSGEPGAAGDGGAAETAQLVLPVALLEGDEGRVYVADEAAGRVRFLRPEASVPPPADPVVEVLHAATRQPGALAPGQLAIVRTRLAEPEIRWNGAVLPRLAQDADGWLVLTPRDAAGAATVAVAGGGSTSVPLAEAAPGLFADGGVARAFNEDGARNQPGHPAARGSVVTLFATGEGVTARPVRLTIAGLEAEVLFAGPAPGYPGLLQVNARVPGGFFPAGLQEAVLWVGDARSQPGVALWIR